MDSTPRKGRKRSFDDVEYVTAFGYTTRTQYSLGDTSSRSRDVRVAAVDKPGQERVRYEAPWAGRGTGVDVL